MDLLMLEESTLVRIQDSRKSRFYSNLTVLFQGLAAGHGWRSYPAFEPAPIDVYFREGFAATLAPGVESHIGELLTEICAWQGPNLNPLPLDQLNHRTAYRRSTLAERKAFIARCRDAVLRELGPL